MCHALWHEIEERAIEARGKAFRNLITDGELIMLPGNPPKTLTVRVGRDECSVEASNGIRLPLVITAILRLLCKVTAVARFLFKRRRA